MIETYSGSCEMTEMISALLASTYEASVCPQMLEKKQLVIQTRLRISVNKVTDSFYVCQKNNMPLSKLTGD